MEVPIIGRLNCTHENVAIFDILNFSRYRKAIYLRCGGKCYVKCYLNNVTDFLLSSAVKEFSK